MSNEFDALMLDYFGAEKGAFSPVTKNEFEKSQVTFVGPEQDLAEGFFGDELNRHRGSIRDIRDAGVDPEFVFRKFPTGEAIPLTVSYKTGKSNELRYYLRKDTFKPNPGENWGIFEKDGEIWLCHFSEKLKMQIQNGVFQNLDRNTLLEPESDNYQEIANENQPQQNQKLLKSWRRDPTIAAEAMEKAKYQCELFPEWPTFVSRTTGKPFMEAHHLIPMKQQTEFANFQNLDVVENICVLNPLAHRMLHHGEFALTVEPLTKLISSRKNLIHQLGLLEDDVLSMYR